MQNAVFVVISIVIVKSVNQIVDRLVGCHAANENDVPGMRVLLKIPEQGLPTGPLQFFKIDNQRYHLHIGITEGGQLRRIVGTDRRIDLGPPRRVFRADGAPALRSR